MTDQIKTVTMSPAEQMREAAAQVRFAYVDEDGEPYTRGLTFYQQNCIRALPLPPDPRDEVIARLVDALGFYADMTAWTQPPVKTREGLLTLEYENQASKMQKDRGAKARAALAAAKAVQHG